VASPAEVAVLTLHGGYSARSPLQLESGRWYTIEVRRKLNDAGADNGILQMWVDGVLIVNYQNARIRAPRNGSYGANYSYGTNWVMVSDYPANSVLQTQSTRDDDVKFSTTAIGAGTEPPPANPLPAAPSNLRISR
jgi:hypothetical protein